MIYNYQAALVRELVYEGNKVDDPQDPGGRTNRGITQHTYDVYRRHSNKAVQDVFLMADDECADIYRQMYWSIIRGDELPKGVDFAVFDAAVNSGTGQATKWLQRALGRAYQGDIDGVFGLKTLAAVRKDPDNDALIDRFLALRLGTLQSLKGWRRFGKGWTARIANVKKISQAWATGSVGPDPVDVRELGGHTKAPVTGQIKTPTIGTGIMGAAATIGTVGTGAAEAVSKLKDFTDLGDQVKWVLFGLTLVTLLSTGIVWLLEQRAKLAEGALIPSTVDPTADEDLVPVNVEQQ